MSVKFNSNNSGDTQISRTRCLFIPMPLHHMLDYIPTIPEIAIAIGVYAAGGLILTVLYKLAITVKEEVSND